MVSTCFGVNCASGETKLTAAGTRIIWQRIQDDARLGADCQQTRGPGRQKHLHVDVLQAQQSQDRATRTNDFAGFCKAIQQAPGRGREQRAVADLGGDPAYFSFGGGDLAVGGCDTRPGGPQDRGGDQCARLSRAS